MTPFVLIFNDAFEYPDQVLTEIKAHDFEVVTSPVDSVKYPGIQKACAGVDNAMWLTLRRVFPYSSIDMKYCFARLMVEGETQPHRVHQDKTMADYSAHIYLNQKVFPGTGTQFWEHPLFGASFQDGNPMLPYDKINDPFIAASWKKTMFVPARFNRLLVHDSALWHSAEPNYGFGTNKDDARLVLTTFFNLRAP